MAGQCSATWSAELTRHSCRLSSRIALHARPQTLASPAATTSRHRPSACARTTHAKRACRSSSASAGTPLQRCNSPALYHSGDAVLGRTRNIAARLTACARRAPLLYVPPARFKCAHPHVVEVRWKCLCPTCCCYDVVGMRNLERGWDRGCRLHVILATMPAGPRDEGSCPIRLHTASHSMRHVRAIRGTGSARGGSCKFIPILQFGL
jgi:hypothetical protein